jgi:hypothetical protein
VLQRNSTMNAVIVLMRHRFLAWLEAFESTRVRALRREDVR